MTDSITSYSSAAQPIPEELNSTKGASLLVPTSSCSSLSAPYTSSINSARFAPHCRTWYRGNNLLGVYVYTFEACMDVCASYNSYDYMHNSSRCYSVTYDAVKTNTGDGNCWLKARPNIIASARDVTDSAVLEWTCWDRLFAAFPTDGIDGVWIMDRVYRSSYTSLTLPPIPSVMVLAP